MPYCIVVPSIVGIVNFLGTATAPTTGTCIFVQVGTSSEVTIRCSISKLSAGTHGWHVHENGVLGVDCDGVGPHFNPLIVSTGEVLAHYFL